VAIDWSKSLGNGNKPSSATPKGGINWGQALIAPAPPPSQPRNNLEDRLVSSFRSIDPNRRSVILTNFQKQAKAGNQDAARKLEILAPHLDAPAPQPQDFAPKDFGSKLSSTLYDLGKGVVESAKTTGQTIATVPHAVNAAGIALASMAEHQHGAQLAKSKQAALNEIQKTPYGKNFGKTVAENKQLAGIGGTSLENVLNTATLGEGTVAKQAVEQGAKAIASKAAIDIAAKQAAKGTGGYIRSLFSGQFAKTAIHPDDAAVMATFIDHARGITKLAPDAAKQLELDASRIAEHYNIGGKATTLSKLANAFDKVLTSSPEALRNKGIGEAGKIGLPKGGPLLTASGGSRLVKGAALGAGYGVAQAGEQDITNPGDIAKIVGTSALTGGIAAGAAPAIGKIIGNTAKGIAKWIDKPVEHVAEERVIASGKKFPDQKSYDNAIKTEANGIKQDPNQLRAIDAAYNQDGFKGLNAETGKPGTASVPIGVSVEGVKPTKGTPLVQTQEQAVKGRAIASNTKQNLSSRVQQYEASLQNSIKGIEDSAGYQQLLAEHGGDKVISNESVLSAAKQLGPLDEHLIMNAKPLDKIDTVTLVRAKATLDVAAKDFTDAWSSGKYTDSQLTRMSKHISGLEAGYKIMSAEPGRATQIQSTFIDDAFKRAQKLKDLMNETKGATPEIRNERIAQDLADFDKKLAQASKSGQVSASTATKLKTAFVKYVGGTARGVSEYGTASKLTSPLTHAKNIVSNLATLLQKGAENTFTTSWAAAKGETSLGQLKHIFGSSQGLKNASEQLVSDLKQSFNPKAKDLSTGLSKGEHDPAISGTAFGATGKLGKAIDYTGKVIRTPFNFLAAGDNFFKTMLRDSEYHQQAFGKAYREGFRGDALKSRVDELVKSPTSDMIDKAENVAKEFTFQDDPGVIANKLGEILGKLPLLRLLVPFIKTPSNVVRFQYQRSALGLFSKRNIQDIAAGGIERREAVARLAVGGGMTLASTMAVMNLGDKITGAAPSNQGEKDNFYAAGKKPYSILINGKWWQYNSISPVGQYLTQAVALRDALTSGDSKTAGNIFSSMGVTIGKGILDLPFVSGVNNVIAALNDPSNQSLTNKAFGQIITGLIPNVSRDIANAQDSTPRVTKSITDQVKAMLPKVPGVNPNFNKQSLLARQTVFGSEQVDSRTGLERGLLKITSNDQSNKLTRALDDIGKQTGYYPKAPDPKTKVNGQVLPSDKFLKYQKEAGTLFTSKLEKALMDSKFNQLTADDKQSTVEKMIKESRATAADDVVGKSKKNPKHKIKSY
jgi:hypothetical protein